MNSQSKNTFHLVNIIKRIKKDSIQDLQKNDDLIFCLNIPPKDVDGQKLDNPISEIQELGLDALPNSNSCIFQQQNGQTISGIFDELFQSAEFDGKSLEQDHIDFNFQNQIQDLIQIVTQKRSQYLRICEKKKDGVTDVNNDPDVQKKLNILKEAEQNFNDLIESNQEKYYKIAQFKYFQAKLQHDKQNYLPTKIIPSMYKEYFKKNLLGHYNYVGFQKFEYNSQIDKLDFFQENEKDDNELSQILSGCGLGRNLENQLEQSIDEAFDSIQIKAEFKRIDFTREWFDPNVFNLKKLQLKNYEQFSWSNGKKIQDKDAKFPYIPVAAIIIRNIEIQGFKNNDNQIQLLNQIKSNPKLFYSLFFQLDETLNITLNPIKISIQKPKILGYILRPLQPFPLSGSKIIPQIQQKIEFKQHRQIDDDVLKNIEKIDVQNEIITSQKQILENEVYFSATDNFQNEQNIKIFASKQFMFPKDQKIRVMFINKNSYTDKYFINFENLYQECINEWIYMMCIDMKIVDQFDNSNFEIINLNVIVDKSGQTFTKGFGEQIICVDSVYEYNQKFGFQEFQQLISDQQPDQQLKIKCKAIIIHEIGRVFGLFREQPTPNNIKLNVQKVLDFYRKNIELYNKENNIVQSFEEVNKLAQQRADFNIFYKKDFSNFSNVDYQSVMHIDYPKSWVLEPANYQPIYNSNLSRNDKVYMNEMYQDLNFKENQQDQFINSQQIIEKTDQSKQRKKVKFAENDDMCHEQNSDQNIIIQEQQKQNEIVQDQKIIIQEQPKPNENVQDQNPFYQFEVEVQECIDYGFTNQQILDNFETHEASKIKNWKPHLIKFIKEMRLQLEVKQLPSIQNYQQKLNMQQKFTSSNFLIDYEREIAQGNILFETKYKGLTKQEVGEFKKSFEKFKILTDRLDQVFEEDKQICFDYFQRSNDNTEFEILRGITFIKNEVLQELFEQYNKDQKEKQKEDDILSEIKKQEQQKKEQKEAEEYKKRLQEQLYSKVKQCIQIKFTKQQIQDNCKDIPLDNIIEEIEKAYNDIKSQMNVQTKIPKFDNYKQKRNLVQKLLDNDVNLELDENITQSHYDGITKQNLILFKKFYYENKFITSIIEEILPEEMKNVQALIKEQKENSKLNFIKLESKTLIKQEVIEAIFDQEVNRIADNFEDNDDFVFNTFVQYQTISITKVQLIKMIVSQNKDLKSQMIIIFRNSFKDYLKLKKIFDHNQFGQYLFENEIEEFLKFVKDRYIKKAIDLVQKYFYPDPILVLKLFYYLNNQSQLENANINENINRSMQIVINQNYKVIQTFNNQNPVRTIQKAILILGKDDIEQSYEDQIEYEDRQLFLNKKPEDIKQFLIEFQSLNQSNENQIKRLFSQYPQLDLKESDVDFIEMYRVEQEGFEKVMKDLKKDINDNQKGQFNKNDFEQISQIYKRLIILHEKDMKKFESFGEMYIDNGKEIHIQYDNMNEAYMIIKPINLKIKLEVVNASKFKKNYQELFGDLPLWMRHFFGFKNLFQYIFNEQSNLYNRQRIEELDEIAKKYMNFEKDPSEESFKQMLLYIIGFQNQNEDIFKEWYEQIQANSETGKIGKLFASKYDFYQARSDTSILLKMLELIKEKFPDPPNIFKLQDFNRLSSRVDINTQTQRFQDIKNNPAQFVQILIQQMFGCINRRENISSIVSVIWSLRLQVEISSRFLLNLVLQNSDIELRTRIIHYQSEYYSVPLIMNCQSSFQSGNYNLKYVPEIIFNMLEGIGIFNFAAGKRCIHPVGKSQLLNDLLYPTAEFSHEAFEQQDKNLFSSGQVDVFFEKSFDVQRDFVLMDGQGLLKQEAIESALILTNIVLINFHQKDLEEEVIVDDLKNKIKLIKSAQDNYNKIMIILIIRDATDTKVLKQNKNERVGDSYKLLQKLENDIDQAIQLRNMSVLQKMQRIEELKPMLLLFYKAVESMNKNKANFKFTKENFANKFIFQDKSDGSKSQIIKDIIEKSNNFILQINHIKDNIFSRNALPLLDVQNKLRQRIIQIRNTVQNDDKLLDEIEKQNQKALMELEDQKKSIFPTEILKKFKELVFDVNSSIIFSDIAKSLRKMTFENIKQPKQIKMDIIERQKEEAKKNQQYSQQEMDDRLKRFHQQIAEIDNQIYQKSISLEYFWRCLIYYLDQETDFKEWNQGHHRNSIIKCIENQLRNGDCFELIDGENLEFKGLLIQEVVKFSMNDKVIVVCVIGPQSSGKSTLLNFAFGTQFFTSTGRCTKGIYFTLQKFPEDIPNNAGVKWLIMLDTEGLQSPERIDDEYDRKIVLFAMLSSDVLIINNRGEIHATMINTLKVCCVTYDDIQQLGNRPEIIYTYGQNAIKDKEPFKVQVQDLKTKVIEAKMDSKTIEKTAEDLLGYNDDKINVFGYAYKNEIIEKDNSKGLQQDITYKINVTQFGVETARILEIISKAVNDKNKNFKDVQLWISDSKKNWDLIDRFCKNIVQFQDLSQFIVDKKVMDFMNNQWNSYIINQNVYANDEVKSNQEVKKLIETFKKYGQVALLKEQNETEQYNSEQKDQDLERHVMDHYNKWKKEPEQSSITIPIELKYIKEIKAKNEVLKDQFLMLIKNKLQEQKMIHMSKNGIKGVQLKAIELMRSEEFQQKEDYEKQSILKYEFKQAFDNILNECKDKQALKQIQKNYFNSLVKSFSIQNKFILPISDEEYDQIVIKIEEELKDYNSQDSRGLENFLVTKMNEPDKYYKHNLNENLFTFNNEYILQIPDDPKDRIFDPKKPENFLELKNLVMCNYTYKLSSDLGRDLDRNNLFEAIMAIFKIKKLEKKEYQRQNFYGSNYKEKIHVEVDDEIAQMSQIRYLFTHLQDAGFRIRVKQKVGDRIMDLLDLDLQKEFKEFGNITFTIDQKAKKYDNQRKWAKEICDWILFERSNFKKLNNTILYLFNSKTILIQNCNSPFETFSQHQKENYELRIAAYVSAPEIKYVQSNKSKQNNKFQEFEILIKPKTTDDHLLTKYNKLSRVAFRNLSWHKIAQHIITSVRELMKVDSKEEDSHNSNVDLEEVIKLNTFTTNQIRNLESKYLNTQLKEVLNEELKKLCLYISKDFDAKISWCAIFVCWVELFKKAEKQFNAQYEYLKKQRGQIENEFYKIVNGKSDEITVISTKQLVEDSIKQYLDEVKNKITLQILNQDFQKINSQFDTLEIYKNLDTKYLKQQLYDKYTQQQFIMYVENPDKMFEDEVNEMYQDIIQPIFKRNSINAKNIIGDAFNSFQKLLSIIQQQLNNFNSWDMVTIEKYFDLKDENSQILDNQQLLEISQYFSPVIYEVLIRIMVGSFDMNEFQFKITNKQNTQVNYTFQPKKEEDGGPLEVFADKNFQNSIINFHNNLQQEESELIGLIIQQLKSFQQSKTYEIFEINKTFKQIQQTLQIKQDEFFRNTKDYDENDFNCKDAIDGLRQNAIGCTQKCQFCKRKCELSEHSPQNGVKHSCEQMGHQMRVFAGGHFENTRGNKIPSLFTCDIIDPQTQIMVDGQMFFWREILGAELKDWTITYQKDTEQQIDRKKVFDKFWIMVGQKYCQDNGYEYIEKNDNIAEGNQMHESEVIVIALDGSGSMSGSPWDNVVNGAKKLINYIKLNHVNKSKVRLIAIVFNDNAQKLYDGDIDGQTENIWQFPSGGTNFDPPLNLAMQGLSAHISSKDLAKLYFFTDGCAGYPQSAVQSIKNQITQNQWLDSKTKQLKLSILLICSNDNNKNMELVRNDLNNFSQKEFKVNMCDLKQNIDVSRLGDQMIEHFKFNKVLQD